MLLIILVFAAGIFLVVKGGDIFIDAAGWVSDATGVSRAVIGATVVSFATTAPEYFVSLIAVLKGSLGLSTGNAVGSLLCNIGIAFAAVCIFTPGDVKDRLFTVKSLIMIGATAALWFFCGNGGVSSAEGLALLAFFAAFMFINIRTAKESEAKHNKKPVGKRDIILNIFKFIGGAAGIVYGSNLIVDSARSIAQALGVSEAVIGVTVVAVGTSLPEIVTSIAAIIKKQNALSVGNIIGANVFDATLILATGSFVSGGSLYISPVTVNVDLPATLLVMATAVIPTIIGGKLYRWQGALIALEYFAYIVFFAV